MASAQTVASMLDASLWWASRGFSVFPVFEMTARGCACGTAKCPSPGKHPRVERWQVVATTDEKTVREWWLRWPGASIGICCGRELEGGGHLLVVDVDPRHDGDMHLALLEQKYGPLPETPRNVTGGGGQHIFLRSPRPVKSRSNALGPGVDVKCERGYVLAPPSTHESGARYRRDSGADIAEMSIADAPSWLVTLADPPEVTSREERSGADLFVQGGRHDAMVSLAGTLRRRGLTGAEMLPTMLAVNTMRCRPALDDHEVKQIAYSAKWTPGDPLPTGETDRWNIMSTGEIFAPLPPYPWLIQGLHVAPGRITLLNGYADVGKTVIAMTLALGVASGRPIWSIFAPARRGIVLHLNGEIGSYIARERYQRLARAAGIDVDAMVADGALRLANYPMVRLDDPDFEALLVEQCRGVALVIVDSLRAFSGALDENSKQIGIALLMLARVSQATGATIIVLHHNRKPSKDDIGGAKMAISGSSSILGGSECAFVMTAEEKGGPIRVQHERSPIGRPLADFGLRIEDVPNGNDPRWGLRVLHLEGKQLHALAEDALAASERADSIQTAQTILELLKRHAGAFRGSRESLRAMAGVRRDLFLKTFSELILSGAVVQQGTYHQPEFALGSTSGVQP